MEYYQVSCLKTEDVDKVIRESIAFVCQNINSNLYPWDEKKKWDKFGIAIKGDREVIDNPPHEPSPPVPAPVAGPVPPP